MRKCVSGWKLFGIIVGTAALVSGALVLQIRASADHAWAEMERRKRELIAEAKSRPSGRAVLRGTAEAGNAWTDYKAALRDLVEIDEGDGFRQVLKFQERDADANRAVVEEMIVRNAVSLAGLRRGVRRAEGAYSYDWDTLDDQASFKYLSVGNLTLLAVLSLVKARLEREAGKPTESAEILLDLLLLGNDVRRNSLPYSHAIGGQILWHVLNEFPLLLGHNELRSKEWETIGRELEILDHEWPAFTATLRNESLMFQATLLKSPVESESSWLKTWRFGFSKRLMAAHAGLGFHQQIEQLVKLETGSWLRGVEGAEAKLAVLKSSLNPLLQVSNSLEDVTYDHKYRAQLRLLRLAAQYKCNGTVGFLDDPFGTRLRNSTTKSMIRFWSLGRDGLDQGGKGEWLVDRGNGDIVLEIFR